MDIDNLVPDRIDSDPTRLRQILFNIIGNAVKFTDRGGVKVRVLAKSNEDGAVRFTIEVEDTPDVG